MAIRQTSCWATRGEVKICSQTAKDTVKGQLAFEYQTTLLSNKSSNVSLSQKHQVRVFDASFIIVAIVKHLALQVNNIFAISVSINQTGSWQYTKYVII